MQDGFAAGKGKSLADKGIFVTDKGKAIADKGMSVADKGKSVADKGKSVADKGKSVADKGMSVAEKGKSVADASWKTPLPATGRLHPAAAEEGGGKIPPPRPRNAQPDSPEATHRF